MPRKYLVVEIKNTTDLGKIVGMLSDHTERIAIVDEVPGVFCEPNNDDITGFVRSRASNSSQKRSRLADSVEDENGDVYQNSNPSFEELTKENMDMLESSILEELSFIAPSDHCKTKGSVVRSLKKKIREEGETALSARRKVTETVLVCGLCQSKMTLRASYGRTRLREHVMRHLNIPTARCSHCDFQGILREHVRRHYILKHKDIPPQIIELEPEPDYNERFDTLWKICFPHTDHIQARMTSQRARFHEAHFYGNMKDDQESENNDGLQDTLTTEDVFTETKPPVMDPVERTLSDDDFYEPNETFTTVSV